MNYALHGWIQLVAGTLMVAGIAWRFRKAPSLLTGGFLVMGAGFIISGISLLKNVRDDYEPFVLVLTGIGFLMTIVAAHRGGLKGSKDIRE